VRRSGDKARQELLRFESAAEVREKEIRQYINGVYAGTIFQIDWLDRDRRPVFKIRGNYRERGGKPVPRANEHHFALAAKRRWYATLLPALLAQIDRGQVVRFNVGKTQWIDAGPKSMEFGLKRKPVRLEAADIKEVKLHKGLLTIKPKGKGFFGAMTLRVGEIGNLLAFLAILEKAYGVRLG
jgi:hypothetical protein